VAPGSALNYLIRSPTSRVSLGNFPPTVPRAFDGGKGIRNRYPIFLPVHPSRLRSGGSFQMGHPKFLYRVFDSTPTTNVPYRIDCKGGIILAVWVTVICSLFLSPSSKRHRIDPVTKTWLGVAGEARGRGLSFAGRSVSVKPFSSLRKSIRLKKMLQICNIPLVQLFPIQLRAHPNCGAGSVIIHPFSSLTFVLR
jgi:hypothetical protein